MTSPAQTIRNFSNEYKTIKELNLVPFTTDNKKLMRFLILKDEIKDYIKSLRYKGPTTHAPYIEGLETLLIPIRKDIKEILLNGKLENFFYNRF
jgi:hypothetical protein